jgi:hypothetical protein
MQNQMALAYGKTSPHDILAKAERDLARLKAAEAAQDDEAMGDSLFDLAVALTSVKDWLKEHPRATFAPSAVESYVAGSTALNSFRDIANGGKHRVVRNYVPQTMSVLTSATGGIQAVAVTAEVPERSGSPDSYYRLKVIRTDGSRHRAVDLGQDVVREWRAFMNQHGLAA